MVRTCMDYRDTTAGANINHLNWKKYEVHNYAASNRKDEFS